MSNPIGTTPDSKNAQFEPFWPSWVYTVEAEYTKNSVFAEFSAFYADGRDGASTALAVCDEHEKSLEMHFLLLLQSLKMIYLESDLLERLSNSNPESILI